LISFAKSINNSNKVKKIFVTILILLTLVVVGSATDLQFNLRDPQFGLNQVTNVPVQLQAQNIQQSGAVTLLPWKLTQYTDTNGVTTFTNIYGSSVAGFYHFTITVPNTSKRVDGNVWIQSTNLGVVSASSVDLVVGAPTYPAGTWAWSAYASDIRYAGGSNLLSSYVTIGQLNNASNTLQLQIFASTNGFLPIATNIAYWVYSNNPAGYLSQIPVAATNLFLTSVPIGATNKFVTTNDTTWFISQANQIALTNGYLRLVPVAATNQFATTNYAASLVQATNGFVTASITNGLATTNYVNSATNGFVTASITNGVVFNNRLLSASNSIVALIPSTNGFITAANIPIVSTNQFATTNYVIQARIPAQTNSLILYFTNESTVLNQDVVNFYSTITDVDGPYSYQFNAKKIVSINGGQSGASYLSEFNYTGLGGEFTYETLNGTGTGDAALGYSHNLASTNISGLDARFAVGVGTFYGLGGQWGASYELLTKKRSSYWTTNQLGVFTHPFTIDGDGGTSLGDNPESEHTKDWKSVPWVRIRGSSDSTRPQFQLEGSMRPFSGSLTNGAFYSDGTNVWLIQSGVNSKIATLGISNNFIGGLYVNGTSVLTNSASTNGFLSTADTNSIKLWVGSAIAGSNYLSEVPVASTNKFVLTNDTTWFISQASQVALTNGYLRLVPTAATNQFLLTNGYAAGLVSGAAITNALVTNSVFSGDGFSITNLQFTNLSYASLVQITNLLGSGYIQQLNGFGTNTTLKFAGITNSYILNGTNSGGYYTNAVSVTATNFYVSAIGNASGVIRFPNGDTIAESTTGGGSGGETGIAIGLSNGVPLYEQYSFVAGAYNDIAAQAGFVIWGASIAGGTRNSIEVGGSGRGNAAFIAGGSNNVASGAYSFTAGARNYTVNNGTFALGYNAAAQYAGSFVWSGFEPTSTQFADTSTNQFLIKAAGGMGINTNNPANYALNIAGIGNAFDWRVRGVGVLTSNSIVASYMATNVVSGIRITNSIITGASITNPVIVSPTIVSALTTNIAVIFGNGSTNTLYFTNGILYNITP
jgi:hypothetical protein